MSIGSLVSRFNPTTLLPGIGIIRTAIGSVGLAEGYWEDLRYITEGTTGVFLTSICANTFRYTPKSLKANRSAAITQVTGRVANTMNASAIFSLANVSIRGIGNMIVGAMQRDLTRIERGASQCVVGNIGIAMVDSLSPEVVSTITAAAASSLMIYKGVKEIASGSRENGLITIGTGVLGAIFTATFASNLITET